MQGLSDYNNGATERRFSPYSDNGGSVVAIAGEDFCVIASDTRLSQFAELICLKMQNVFVAVAGKDLCVTSSVTRLSGHGYAILSREQPKLFKLSETTVLGSTGCWCDILTFCKVCSFSLLTLGGTLKGENLENYIIGC